MQIGCLLPQVPLFPPIGVGQENKIEDESPKIFEQLMKILDCVVPWMNYTS